MSLPTVDLGSLWEGWGFQETSPHLLRGPVLEKPQPRSLKNPAVIRELAQIVRRFVCKSFCLGHLLEPEGE